jgi:putative ABC transport system substrate-binding protein
MVTTKANVAIEYRQRKKKQAVVELATELVRRGSFVIAAPGSPTAAAAATNHDNRSFGVGSTRSNPGHESNRPGGNITGVSTLNQELGPKRLGLLLELLPEARRFAVLVNPNSPGDITDVRAAAAALGRQIETLTASTNLDIDASFASLVQKRVDALLVSPGPPFGQRRVQLATLGARYRVPSILPARRYAEAGGLLC